MTFQPVTWLTLETIDALRLNTMTANDAHVREEHSFRQLLLGAGEDSRVIRLPQFANTELKLELTVGGLTFTSFGTQSSSYVTFLGLRDLDLGALAAGSIHVLELDLWIGSANQGVIHRGYIYRHQDWRYMSVFGEYKREIILAPPSDIDVTCSVRGVSYLGTRALQGW